MSRLNLVWTSDVRKLIAEDSLKFHLEGDVIVLGDSVSLDVLNFLMTKYGSEKIAFVYVSGEITSEVRNGYAQFYLGQAAAKGSEFYVYGGISKEVLGMAAICGVKVITDETKPRKGKKEAPKNPVLILKEEEPVPIKENQPVNEADNDSLREGAAPKRRRKTKEEVKESEAPVLTGGKEEEDILEKPPISEKERRTLKAIPVKEKKKEDGMQAKEGTSLSAKEKGDFIKGIIEGSDLSAEDKKWFMTPGRLAMIEDVVKKSTKETVKFQVRMMFGDKGAVLFDVLTAHWKELEKTLVG